MKSKKKPKTWVCPHGCDLSKQACQHLEQLISEKPGKPSFEGTNRRVDKKIDKMYYASGAGLIFPEGFKNGRYEAQFRRKLRRTGLSQVLLEILVHRFVYEESLAEISAELSIPAISTMYRLYKEGLEYLRKRGMKA